jgi:hypothetical protein
MAPFEELQELWQSQPVALAQPNTAAQAAELTEAFRRYGRRQNFFNALRLGAVLIQIVWVLLKARRTPLTLCGFGLLIVGEAVYLFSDWRTQLGMARLDFTGTSLEFLRTTMQQLYDQRIPAGWQLWTLIACAAAGMNLMVLSKDHNYALLERIAYHLSACATPFAALVLGFRIRGRRWRYVCLPLIERLRSAECALQEGGL